MPLHHGKGKKAFSENVKTEMDAGKPQDQAVAIAYSEKRKAEHKAKGGLIGGHERPIAKMMAEHRDHSEPKEGCSLCMGGMAGK